MELETLVAVVVEEVQRLLNQRAAQPQRLLVVVTGTPCHQDRILAELAQIRDSGRFVPTLLLSHTAAQHWDRRGLEEALGSGPALTPESASPAPALAWEADRVLVPWLALNTAAKLALGVCDNLATSVLMLALLRGIPVLACAEEGDPDGPTLGAWAHPTPALAGMLRSRLATLHSYGMELVPHHRLAAALLRGPAPAVGGSSPALGIGSSAPGGPSPAVGGPAAPAPGPAAAAADPGCISSAAYPARRPVITAGDVAAAAAAGELHRLPANGIWTPMAREAFARAQRLGGTG